MTQPRYYDRAGVPISPQQWGEWFEDYDYCVIEKTPLALGDELVQVSTVWLGLDHSFGAGPFAFELEIFETMVFGGHHDQECWRYATEADARKGHQRRVDDLIAERDNALRIRRPDVPQ